MAHEVAFKIEEIFVILSQKEKGSMARFEKFGNEVFLNPEIIPLIERVNESQSQQAGSTLLYLCQKIASSNGIYIRPTIFLFCGFTGKIY